MSQRLGMDSSPGTQQPIAIVGIGCRFPGGANSPEQFWKLLVDGVDAVGEIMPDRWDDGRWYHPDSASSGRVYTRAAGCIEDFDRFDAEFFGISPREATTMDPQQRVLLEVAWEALEDAGIVPSHLAGSDTGVFIGICQQEYATLQSRDPLSMRSTTNTGGAVSIAANRISYLLDLRGPSYAVDTACSSSLVALDAACKTVWRNEASLAIVGGVNLLVLPEMSVGFSKAQMLSPTGRCRPFDADADGYVRAEGAGVVVLKPLDQAVTDGDRIYATVVSTGLNQDGRSEGLSVPSEDAQAALIRQVLASGNVQADQIQYVEAHGTGTPVGDPIECRALGSVFGNGRTPQTRCRIGSVKANIGHLEGGSGMAGLIKLALSLQHRTFPPLAQFRNPNPAIAFDELNLEVQQDLEPWPAGKPVRTAGINSFGFGGTNGHAIVQEHQAVALNDSDEDDGLEQAEILTISARSSESLTERVKQFQVLLDRDDLELADICRAANVRSSAHSHRLAMVGRSTEEFIENVEAFLSGERRPGLTASIKPVTSAPRVGFVFSGNGPQWWGMARQLLHSEPIFREVVEACDRGLRKYDEWSLLEELGRDEESTRMTLTEIAQPALFAIQMGLVELLKSWGVEPSIVYGHSVGEIAAAAAAGILDFDSALKVIYHRSRSQAKTAGAGAMAAIGLPADDAERWVSSYGGKLLIAAVNSPNGVTVSGDTDALHDLMKRLEADNVYCQKLRIDYAFHSQYMDPIREDLLSSLSDVKVQPPEVPFVSTVTGEQVDGELPDDYWWDNVRKPVRFLSASELVADRCDVILEIGPHPVLSGYVTEAIVKKRAKASVVPTLRRYADDRSSLLTSLGALFTLGQDIDWKRLYPKQRGWVTLPRYPWNRERFWSATEEAKQVHPLLGLPQDAADSTWEQNVDQQLLPYLADHRFEGTAIFPAAGFVELLLAAGRQVFGTKQVDIDQLDILRALTIGESETTSLRLSVSPDGTVQIHGRPRSSDVEWSLHVRAKLRRLESSTPPSVDIAKFTNGFTRSRATDVHYQQAAARGLEYGPDFQGLTRLWLADGEAFSEMTLSKRVAADADAYLFHPTLLDACFQTVFGIFHERDDVENTAFLPVRIGRLRLFRACGQRAYCHIFNADRSDRFLAVDAKVYDEKGDVVAIIDRLCFQEVELGQTRDEQLQYELRWVPAASVTTSNREGRIPNPRQLADDVAATRPNSKGLSDDAVATLERLALRFVQEAMDEVSRDPYFTVDSLSETGRVQPQFKPLTSRYLERLQANGLAKYSDDGWELLYDFDAVPTDELWRNAVRQLPHCHLELLSLLRSRRLLPATLRGEVDPKVSQSSGGGQALTQLFELGMSYRSANERIRHVCRRISASGSSTRVVVIGAATNGLAAGLLNGLDLQTTDLVLAESTPELLQQLRTRFERYASAEFVQLDDANDSDDDSFPAGRFDVVVCARTRGLYNASPVTWNKLGHLLTDEGILVVEQPVLDSAMNELLHGPLLVGEDGVGNSISQDWRDYLAECGFSGVVQPAPVSAGDGNLFLASKGLIAGAETRDPSLDMDHQLNRLEKVIADESSPGAGERHLQPASWLVFSDRRGVGKRLAEALQASGDDVHVVSPGDSFDCHLPGQYTVNPAHRDDFVTLLQTMQFKSDVLTGIVFLWGLDVSPAGQPSAFDESVDACASVVNLAQALDETQQICGRLWLVTESASVSIGEDVPAGLFQAPLWGLGRVVRNELPEVQCTMVEISLADGFPESLVDELRQDGSETEVSLRGGGRYVRRLNPIADPQLHVGKDSSQGFRLELDRVGQFQSFGYREVARRQLEAGEVEIEVKAAGLNFKDVMWAMGMLPGEVMADSFAGPCFGFECAGVVSAVGAGVKSVKMGDEVIAFAPHSFGRYATTVEQAVCLKPEGVDFESASTIPVTFLTAEYALAHLARTGAGERVLIHGGAGGVGMAAIQIVQDLGGEVFATAGTSEKRNYLKRLGVKHVFDSRKLAFGDDILQATEGEGVDVILNSLVGDAMDKSLSLLRPFGRFLEIGKRDFVENNRLRLRPFQNNISYFGIDADQLLKYQPLVANDVLQNVVEKFRQGRYHPLPYVSFAAPDIADAFRFMQRSQHIGKIVVSMSDSRPKIKSMRHEPIRFRANGCYLIVGGLGGIGRSLARWFADNGAGHVVLVGRSAPSEEARKEIESIRANGVQIQIFQADVTDEAAFAAVLQQVRKLGPPLHGVVHTAMVLDDGSVMNLDRSRFERVMACKTVGALNLHNLTKNDPLDHFVMFSSFSSILGNPGQANYAAANAFLDELAGLRRREGLPALTVNWGLFGQVGYAADQDELVQRLRRIGAHPIGPQQAFRILGKLMVQGDREQVTVCDLRWGKWRQVVKDAVSPTWSHLAKSGGVRESAEEGFQELLVAAAADKVPELVRSRLASHFASVLGTSKERLDLDRPITELGLDSLMGVELRVQIESDMGIELSMMKVFSGETISSLAANVIESLRPNIAATPPAAAQERKIKPEAVVASSGA